MGCGIILSVQNNDIIGVEGDPDYPINRGYICPRGESIPFLANDETRLKYPLIRDGKIWKRVSWNEALTYVSDKLREIKNKYGAKALAVNIGQAVGYRIFYWQRFCNAFGTPNYTTGGMHCFWSKLLANYITYGDLAYPLGNARGIMALREEYKDTKCFLIWGVNPVASAPPGADIIIELKKKGSAKLLVVDPRRIELAEMVDVWAQIRPGTDAALALGMINVIIEDELYDREFVSTYTFGFDRLKERAAQYKPEKVEKITWVPAETIRRLAEIYATNRPGVILAFMGIEHSVNGFQAARAIACLMGLTGNLDVKGGNIILPRFPTPDLSLSELPVDGPPLGDKEFPLFIRERPNWTGTYRAHGILLPKAINDGEIKALILVGSDILRSAAETKAWFDAFKKLELLVIIDCYRKPGYDEIAHAYLPAASFLERTELVADYQDPIIAMRRKVVSRWECLEDWKICIELAKKLGYEKYFPWKTSEEIINEQLKASGRTFDELNKAHVIRWLDMIEYQKYKKTGFNTPTGKFEFYSKIMEKYGYDPLPNYVEPSETPISDPKLCEEYPLILTTGFKTIYYTHSQFRNIPQLRRNFPDPVVECHPITAKELNVNDGDWVVVESPRGKITAKVKVTDVYHPKVIHVYHGWDPPHNVNELTSLQTLDPITGYPSLRSSPARIRKV